MVHLSKRGRGKGGGGTGRRVEIEYPAFSLPVAENLLQALSFLQEKKVTSEVKYGPKKLKVFCLGLEIQFS